jgi:hypothetical protein
LSLTCFAEPSLTLLRFSQMWYTPNVASEDQYDEYYPDDPSTVDLIGM